MRASRGGRRLGDAVGLLALAALVLAGPIATGLIGLAGGVGDEFIARATATISLQMATPHACSETLPSPRSRCRPGSRPRRATRPWFRSMRSCSATEIGGLSSSRQ